MLDRMALVHVVGESDTGLRHPRALPEQARRTRLAGWRAEVDAAEGPTLLPLLRQGWSGDLTGDETTPLVPLLGALGSREVDLVLVAGPPDSDGVPSGPVADGLRAAFTVRPDILGPRVTSVAVVTATGFDDEAVAGSVRAALVGSSAPVVMSWGSGSTGIGLGALAGVVESRRPWSLRDSFAPTEPLSLLPATLTNVLVPWLLRLGYPGRVVEMADAGSLDPPVAPAVVELARESAARLDKVANGSAADTDLAELVRCELRRRDHGAALAVRAWLEARYEVLARKERRRRQPAVNLLELARRDRSPTPTLGQAIELVGSSPLRDDPVVAASSRTRSGQWLLGVAHEINGMVKEPAHRWALLPAWAVQEIQKRLPQPTGVAARFGPSTGVVRFVWPVGMPSTQVPPYAQTLLATPLDLRVLAHTGRADRGEVELRCTLLASSPDSAEFAAAQQRTLDDASAGGGYQKILAQVVPVGNQPRGPAVAQAQAAVRAALDADGLQPDVIVVVPVGPKAVVAAAFAASVEYGQEHAVPVLVECTDLRRTQLGYHRVGAYLAADDVLADLALDAARQLDLDTAARLLDLGSPALREASRVVRDLAGRIGDAVRRGDTAALLTLFRTAVTDQCDRVGVLRLAHLAGTHAPRDTRLSRRRNWLPTAHGSGRPAPTAARLTELIDADLGGLSDPRLADAYQTLLAVLTGLTAEDVSA